MMFALIGLMVAIVQGGIVRQLAKRYAASLGWLFGALAIIVAGYSCLQPSLYSLLSRWSDPSQQGKVLGVGQSVSALARIFGSGLGIPMLKATLFLPYLIASILMLAVAIMITSAGRSGRDFSQ